MHILHDGHFLHDGYSIVIANAMHNGQSQLSLEHRQKI